MKNTMCDNESMIMLLKEAVPFPGTQGNGSVSVSHRVHDQPSLSIPLLSFARVQTVILTVNRAAS